MVARMIYFLYTGEYASQFNDCVAEILSNAGYKPDVVSNAVVKTDQTSSDTSDDDDDDIYAFYNDTINVLRTSTLIYQCADRLDIDKLRDLAFDSYKHKMESFAGPLAALSDVIDLAYKVTAANDQQLRLFTTQHCIANHAVVAKDQKLLNIVRAHEPIAWSLAKPMQAEIEGLSSKLQAATAQSLQKAADLVDTESRLERWQDAYKSIKTENDKTQARLSKVLAKKKEQLHSATYEKHAKFCPHCGDSALVMVNGRSGPYDSTSLSTDCLSCSNKWEFDLM